MSGFAIPAFPCLCASIRRATRAITQMYEDALRSSGLSASQFTILQVLSLAGEVNQGQLGRILAMDSTTLTRTLAIMSRQRWILKRRGADRREWRLQLSRAGAARFERAVPAWQKVQQLGKERIGIESWEQLMKLSNELSNAISMKESPHDE